MNNANNTNNTEKYRSRLIVLKELFQHEHNQFTSYHKGSIK